MIQWASDGKESFKGKKVAISGSGNVAQFAALKAIELGATVVSLSDSQGALLATDAAPIEPAVVRDITALKAQRKQLTALPAERGLRYVGDGARPWTHAGKVDVALPCATQNEVSGDEAQALISAGCRFVAEGSNMGCTQAAIDAFEQHRRGNKGAEGVWYGAGKAANAGGVAVSGLEMAQNSQRLAWTADEVDRKLLDIMRNCFDNCLSTAREYVQAEEGELPSLVAGANIAGFSKVAGSMFNQGDWW